ncbi:YbgC/FadM family acyl-CoA thioesterase, partial [Alphaproteobacteria bacterium]|nr:YbgC/FadM family acyl-CoA thioesterase [Alphaproteobacteria bacterium]
MKKSNFYFTYSFRVRYAEVDAQGIVFNAHYLTYFDCAITEYYRTIKYNYINDVKKNNKDFHVIKTNINYKKPLLFDQLIDVCTK